MAIFEEMSGFKQWVIILAGGALVTAVAYFAMFRGMREKNDAAQTALNAKIAENMQLEQYRPKLADMERQLANLKQQLEIERKIVPDDKLSDEFIRMVSAEGIRSGIEIRRFTARPVSARDFYSEVPWELEVDGPYYSVANFFDRLAKMERIVTVSNLLMATPKKNSDAKTKKTYQYAPGESVVATCVATTFFSHDLQPAGSGPAKPGQAPAAVKK